MLETLTTLTQPWADYYSASSWLPTLVIAIHVLAMFIGGGVALGTDRRVLQSAPGSSEAYLAAAADLSATHSIVIASLVVTNLSGVALFASDVGTFWGSRVFWAKMASLVLLTLNAVRLRSAEATVVTNARNTIEMAIAGPEVTGPWQTIKTHAWLSVLFWCVIVVLGVLVANV